MKRMKKNFGSVTKAVAMWLDVKNRPSIGRGGNCHFDGNKLFHGGELVACMTQFNGKTVILWGNPSRKEFRNHYNYRHQAAAKFPLFEMGQYFDVFKKCDFNSTIVTDSIMSELLKDQSQSIDRIFEELDELHTWNGLSDASPHHWNLREFNKLVSRVGLSDLRIDAPKEYLEFAHQYISLCAFATDQIKARNQLQLWKEGKRRRSRR